MAISYNPLWKQLIDKKMKRIDLQRGAGLSANVLARMGKDEHISMVSIEKICLLLHCDVSDVITVLRDKESNQNL